jgi:hypothetical protein
MKERRTAILPFMARVIKTREGMDVDVGVGE